MAIKPVSGEIQSQEINDNLSYLDSKASNPFTAAASSGDKVTMELLGDDVKAAMVGDTDLAEGFFETNRGVTYPLMNIERDGELHEVQERVKRSILSAKVIGAKPNKLYAIDWIGNGFVSQGKTLWGMQITEYPRGESINTSDQRFLTYYSTDDFSEPTDTIVSRTIHIPEENIFFEVTYDRSEFQGTALNIARDNGRGYGCVIHHDNYIYDTSRNTESESSLFFSKTSPTEFTVYIPIANKFLGHTFYYVDRPYESGIKNSNVRLWSYKRAAEYDASMSLVRNFYTEATQDLMIRENDVTDYIGGDAHGDEILQNVEIYVDGRLLESNDIYSVNCSDVKIIQTTFLYRDTSVTDGVLEHVATAKKMHIVDKDGYSLNVSLEFHEELSLRDCFIGALSMSRKNSNDIDLFFKAVFGDTLTEVDLTATESTFERVENVNDVYIFGNGIAINWNATKKENIAGARTWINNSAALQTKLYPSYVPVNYQTNIGEIFSQKTHYKYVIS